MILDIIIYSIVGFAVVVIGMLTYIIVTLNKKL